MYKKLLIIGVAALCMSLFGVVQIHAQEESSDVQGVWKAKVLEVTNQETRLVPGTDTQSTYQTLQVEVLEGERKGQIITIENDFLKLEKGDAFFMNYLKKADGTELYSVRDIERRPTIYFLIALFVAVIISFGGRQGIRSLISLAGSLLIILYVLLPALLKGYNPVLMSTLIATCILFLAIYFTHGFNKESTAAFLGTVIAIVVTGILASLAVSAASLSGFASDESVFLNLTTRGTLNMQGLLLGAIIIGVLGVLDDIAITQATVVRELYGTAPHLKRLEIYKIAIRVGKEHVGALVNTLALAYTGASLPLLLLFSSGSTSVSMILNYEIFATEVIRTIIGSIGLILTVPIVTGLAVVLLEKTRGQKPHHAHGHSHSHNHVH
ncbi:MAG: YibE/F family protein [Patescibacteria group bacterium]